MHLPPLNALRAFEAAARLLSFSRAADELHVTHSAVSHQVRNLEDWLGRPLFERRATGVSLTRTGEALSAHLSPSFSTLADLCTQLQANQGQKSLSVGCIPSIASRWLVPNITAFSRAYPEISVQVLYAMAEQRLSLGNLDVLITLGDDPSPDVANTFLFSRINKPVASPHYLARMGPLDTAAKIAAADLLHDETRTAWEAWIEAAGLPVRTPPPGPLFQDFNLLATAAIAGHGVALCPVEVFREELRRGDLVILSDIATNEGAGYFMITDKKPAKAVQAFMAWFSGIVSA
jgi:DNA-binding transcriptional LysR family regulator